MANKQNLSFEMEFLDYLVRVLSSSATFKKSRGEMMAILNRMRSFKSANELQTALDALRAYLPLDLLVYPTVNDAIKAVEISLDKVVLHSGQAEREKIRAIANDTYVNRVKTSDRHQKEVMNFIRS